MSLIRAAIRMCTRAALYNSTLAEGRIFDSRNTPLADVLTEDAAPYISIYTDSDNRSQVGRELFLAQRSLSLVLEMGCAKAVVIEGSSPTQFRVEIPESDEGLELVIDAVEGQALAVFANPVNEWGEFLRRFILRYNDAPSHRGGQSERGTRWAARQLTLNCDVVADCPPGVVPEEGHVLYDFIAAAKASPMMSTAGLLLEKLINQTAAPEWRQAQAWIGATRLGIEAIGLAPVLGEEETSQLGDLVLSDYVPAAPALTHLESPSVPSTFLVTLPADHDDERDAKVDDVVQLAVDLQTYPQSISSQPLTAADLANGSVLLACAPLPPGSHTAVARLQRAGLTSITGLMLGDWSTEVSFYLVE